LTYEYLPPGSNRWQVIYYITISLNNPISRTKNILCSLASCNSHIHLTVDFTWSFRRLYLHLYSQVSDLSTCNKHSDKACIGIALSTRKVQSVLFPGKKGSACSTCCLSYCHSVRIATPFAFVYCVIACECNPFRIFSKADIYFWGNITVLRLLPEKNCHTCWNISIKFLCVCMCLSYCDLFNFW
jgi:hypothetical protein